MPPRAPSSIPRSFFKKLMDNAPHLVSNVQVTMLAQGGAFTRPADTPDVEVAADVVGKMAIPGLVEKFDESLVAAEYFLKPAFPRLRLDYLPQNVSRPLGANSADRQEWLRHSWGSDLYATLETSLTSAIWNCGAGPSARSRAGST